MSEEVTDTRFQQLQLPDKQLFQDNLHELLALELNKKP